MAARSPGMAKKRAIGGPHAARTSHSTRPTAAEMVKAVSTEAGHFHIAPIRADQLPQRSDRTEASLHLTKRQNPFGAPQSIHRQAPPKTGEESVGAKSFMHLKDTKAALYK